MGPIIITSSRGIPRINPIFVPVVTSLEMLCINKSLEKIYAVMRTSLPFNRKNFDNTTEYCTLNERKSRMPQIWGIKGEAVVVYCEPLITKKMGYHRLFQRINKMGFFNNLYLIYRRVMKMHLNPLKCIINQRHKIFLPFCLRSIRVVCNTAMRIFGNKSLHEFDVISGCNFALIFDAQIDIL